LRYMPYWAIAYIVKNLSLIWKTTTSFTVCICT
jgi:hypothetical protein